MKRTLLLFFTSILSIASALAQTEVSSVLTIESPSYMGSSSRSGDYVSLYDRGSAYGYSSDNAMDLSEYRSISVNVAETNGSSIVLCVGTEDGLGNTHISETALKLNSKGATTRTFDLKGLGINLKRVNFIGLMNKSEGSCEFRLNSLQLVKDSDEKETSNSGARIVSVTYTTLSGRQSSKPFKGLNIITYEYDDGTTRNSMKQL